MRRVILFFVSSELLLSADIGEGLFFAGQNHVALKVLGAPFEHELITSNPEELMKRTIDAPTQEAEPVQSPVAASQPEADRPFGENATFFQPGAPSVPTQPIQPEPQTQTPPPQVATSTMPQATPMAGSQNQTQPVPTPETPQPNPDGIPSQPIP